MKKLGLILVVLVFTFTAQGQDNVAKIGVGSLLGGAINLEYERVLTPKSSVLFEVSYRIPRDAGNGIFTATGIDDTENNIVVDEGIWNDFYLVGEYRFYVKGGAAKGFYVAPYLKHARYSIDFKGTYNNNANNLTDIPTSINASLAATSIGASIGYQWLINDKIAINWNILGLGGSWNTISAGFTAEDENVFAVWEQDIRDFLADVPRGSAISLASDNATKTIDAAGSFPLLAMRVSLSVGYAF